MADANGDGSEADADPGRTVETLGAAVVTVSSERTLEADEPSAEVVRILEAAGHEIETRERIEKAHDNVQSTLTRLVDRTDVDLVVTTGGTGVEPSDETIEATQRILDKDLTSFGEVFTHLVYERIGTRAIAGRTQGGIIDGVPVFCLPGDADATRLATERLIEPEIVDLVEQAAVDADEE